MKDYTVLDLAETWEEEEAEVEGSGMYNMSDALAVFDSAAHGHRHALDLITERNSEQAIFRIDHPSVPERAIRGSVSVSALRDAVLAAELHHGHWASRLERQLWDRIAAAVRTKTQRITFYPHSEAELNQLFARLAAEWREDTYFSSSVTSMVLHPAYQRIIGLGHPALPLIFRELEATPNHWFWALRAITGEDPAKGIDSVEGATKAWLDWARGQGFIS